MNHSVEFIKSAADPSGFINDRLPLVVFAGRSNVGKSSIINLLLNSKSIARVSSTPGKTLHVNYFLVDNRLYFVDLPGYGFSRVSNDERVRWDGLMQSFFENKEFIALGILIVDMRHKPTSDDVMMAELMFSSGYRNIVVANKEDKLNKSQVGSCLDIIKETLPQNDAVKFITFSAKNKTGKDILERETFFGL